MYMIMVAILIIYLVFWAAPAYGTTNVFVFIGICSLVGSLSVMSVKVRASHGMAANCPCAYERALNKMLLTSMMSTGAWDCPEAHIPRAESILVPRDVLLHCGIAA